MAVTAHSIETSKCFRADAGNGHTTERDVQLSFTGGAGAGEASLAGDPEDDG